MQEKIIVASIDTLEITIHRILKEHFEPLKLDLQRIEVDEDSILTRKQAADLLQVSLPTLHNWTSNGEIPSSRIGSRIYYSKHSLLELVKKREKKNGK